MSNFDELCDYMSVLKDEHSKRLYGESGRFNSDDHTYYKSRLSLLEMVLHQAALIRKRDKEEYQSSDDDAGC